MAKIILTLSDTAGASFSAGSFTSGLWGIRSTGGSATNVELFPISGVAPTFTSKQVYTASGPTYSAGSTVNTSIIDPSAGPLANLEIVGPTSASDGQTWIVSFGGSSIKEGPVVYNLIWRSSSVFGSIGANQAEAGDGYLLVYDSLINRWRIY